MSDITKVFFNRDTDQMWIENSDGTTRRIGDGHPGIPCTAGMAASYVMAHMGLIRTSDWLIAPGLNMVRYCTVTTNSSN